MPEFGFEQTQRNSQIQTQKMSQQQIYSLNLLAMSSQDLRSEIYSAVEKNPALEITRDPVESGAENVRKVSTAPVDYLHLGTVSAAGELKADSFQDILESKPDERETLQDHLKSQFDMMRLTPDEHELGTRLIENLNADGFYTLAPVSLLDSTRPLENQAMLDKCIDIIHHLDPAGVCCKDIPESLYIQAQLSGKASPAALFILNGHFDFLDPPSPAKIIKKISLFVEEQKKLSFGGGDPADLQAAAHFTEKDAEDALAFIRTLDPKPARQFGTQGGVYVVPDVYVTKVPVPADKDDFDKHIVAGGSAFSYRISLADNTLPNIELSPGYVEAETSGVTGADKKFITASVRDARVFIENLQFRENTIAKACCAIVRAQAAFFEKGPGYLVPLRQKDIADVVGVHDATISRMANSKYLQCEWGLFAIKYFFTNAVPSVGDVSKESAKFEISRILASQPSGAKPLSDQKIADMLEQKGITIARRTVAKYRAELDIDSSYAR